MLPPANLPATEVRKITSRYVNQEYKISVALPDSYADKDSNDRKYPTVYVLDGNFCFGTVTEAARLLPRCGSFPEVIVVGIGYPANGSVGQAKESFKQLWGLRSRDLTHVTSEAWENKQREDRSLDYIATGGASQFLRFVKKELVPLIDSEYRADTSCQVLAGHSLGGLFVLYTLFHESDLFQGYVAASPSLWFGERSIFSTEDKYAQKKNDLPVKLYLCVGQKEEGKESGMVSNLFRLSALLESRGYNSLTIKNQVFENLNHCESAAPGIQFGLMWIFS